MWWLSLLLYNVYKGLWIITDITFAIYVKSQDYFLILLYKSWLTLHIYCVVFRISSSKVISNSTLIFPTVFFRKTLKVQNMCTLGHRFIIIIPTVRLASIDTACVTSQLKGTIFFLWWRRRFYCHIIRSIYNQQC